MWAVSNELVAANHPLHWSVRLAAVLMDTVLWEGRLQ